MNPIAITLLVIAAAASAHALIPRAIPLYKQCDQQWANDQMGTTASCNACGEQPATVCEQGCAMSCVTMALAGAGVTVPQVLPPARTRGTHAGHRQRQNRVTPTPGTMNAWLHATGGYWCAWGDCNNLMLTAPERLSTSAYNVSFVSENEKPELAVLQMWILTDGFIPIGHVRNKTHFVLLTGWDDADPNTLYVNDPGFPQTSYLYSDVADVLLYTVLPPNAPAVTKADAFAAPNAAPRAFQSAGPTTGWLSRAKLWGNANAQADAQADADADADAASADAAADW